MKLQQNVPMCLIWKKPACQEKHPRFVFKINETVLNYNDITSFINHSHDNPLFTDETYYSASNMVSESLD